MKVSNLTQAATLAALWLGSGTAGANCGRLHVSYAEGAKTCQSTFIFVCGPNGVWRKTLDRCDASSSKAANVPMAGTPVGSPAGGKDATDLPSAAPPPKKAPASESGDKP